MPAPLPPLYALQAFLAAARHGSFTSAAQQLHLTQSAVSRQVQLLEEWFGCPLFVRQARGLALTAEGQALLAPVEEALQALAQASAQVRRSMGVLTVQLPPTLQVRWFLPRLPQLKDALPELEVRVSTHWAAVPDFARAGVDVIVAHGPGGWPNVVERLLMREVLTPMCAPALRERLRTPADLGTVTLLHPSPHMGEWAAWMRGAGVQRHEAQRDQVFDTLDMSLQAAERGQGVAIADPAMLGEVLQSGRLVMPFGARVPSGNSYFITYPPQRQGQRKIALFEAWLLAQMTAAEETT
jgi:DNA-binding transcriptional LysR family regulator